MKAVLVTVLREILQTFRVILYFYPLLQAVLQYFFRQHVVSPQTTTVFSEEKE
jgi:hypothetical protein